MQVYVYVCADQVGRVEMELHKEKHIAYVKSLDTKRDELQYWLSAHLRMNGLYWGLTALYLLGAPEALDHGEVVKFVLSCYDAESGGFAAHPGFDAHILHTLSAVQVLFTVDALDKLPDRARTVKFITGLQRPNGEVMGDQYGEVDARFLYTAVQTLCLLGALDALDTAAAVQWLAACQNFDGGFGNFPGAESHGAMAFTVVGSLYILGHLDKIDTAKAAAWLSDRQTPKGGLNGRPEKLPDVCYSWWILSALAMMGKVDWIDTDLLTVFILKAQDPDDGGIADREGDEADVFHTVFGLAGLALMGFPDVEPVSPVFCLPASVVPRIPAWPGQKYQQT